jgi:hypothetical protein
MRSGGLDRRLLVVAEDAAIIVRASYFALAQTWASRMISTTRLSIIALSSIMLLLQACASPAPQREPEAKITEALACFPNAWNRADMSAFGGCFTTDADFVNAGFRGWTVEPSCRIYWQGGGL